MQKFKIIIYGLGGGGKLLESLINYEKAEIIAYADSFSNDLYYNNKPLYNKDKLKNVEFDYIIIAAVNKEISEKILEELEQMGIDKRKLFNFYEFIKYYYLKRKEDRLLENKNEEITGLILGISYAYRGINPELLEGCFYNFSSPSQDLYYNYERLEYIYNNYFDRIKNLQYVIFDLHCYDYFNYDCSMTISALDFLKQDGFKMSLHNLKNNRNIDMYDYSYKMNTFKDLICETNIKNNEDNIKFDLENEYGFFPIKEEEYMNTPKRIDFFKFHVKTFSENVLLFDKILSLLYKINNEIKIYFVFLPVFRSEMKNINKSDIPKRFMFSILEVFRMQYKFDILNFRYYKPIVSNKELFYDATHLNQKGAKVFTETLNNIIFRKSNK